MIFVSNYENGHVCNVHSEVLGHLSIKKIE
jgi:hypothetical protein